MQVIEAFRAKQARDCGTEAGAQRLKNHHRDPSGDHYTLQQQAERSDGFRTINAMKASFETVPAEAAKRRTDSNFFPKQLPVF